MLLERRAVASDHRPEGHEGNGARNGYRTRLLAKIVGYWRRQGQPREGKPIVVSTAADVFLRDDGDDAWTIPGDYLRTRLIGHNRQRHRLQREAKSAPRHLKPRVFAKLNEVTALHRRWIDNALHTLSAQILSRAKSRRAAAIMYSDTARDYLPEFPYFRLRELVRQKCEAAGIVFHVASGDVECKTQEPLSEE